VKEHLAQCSQRHSDSPFRKRMNTRLFDLNSPVGKRLYLMIMVIIVCGAFVSMLETLQHVTDRWESVILTLSIIVTVLFSIEYLFRIYAAKSPLRYMFSFYGVIDLLAVLPAIVVGDFNTAIRLLRVLRLLKLIRYLKALELLSNKMVSLPFRYSIVGWLQRDMHRYSSLLYKMCLKSCW